MNTLSTASVKRLVEAILAEGKPFQQHWADEGGAESGPMGGTAYGLRWGRFKVVLAQDGSVSFEYNEPASLAGYDWRLLYSSVWPREGVDPLFLEAKHRLEQQRKAALEQALLDAYDVQNRTREYFVVSKQADNPYAGGDEQLTAGEMAGRFGNIVRLWDADDFDSAEFIVGLRWIRIVSID